METSFTRNELLKTVLKDEEVKKCVAENNIDMETLNQNLNVVLAYTLKKKTCQNCKGLNNCTQTNRGYHPSIYFNGERFEMDYIPCSYQEVVEKEEQKVRNLKLISCNFSLFDFNNFYINEARKEVLTKIKENLHKVLNEEPTKGLYIHGPYGCGKTYILAYLAMQLIQKDFKVTFAYYPDLVRNMKSAITAGTLEEKIEELKNAEVLMLDDFGGETVTPFIRDEVLGTILQDRMTNNRLTYISSNLNENLLMAHLRESNHDIDSLRASRIYERIRALMEFVELKDKNYR